MPRSRATGAIWYFVAAEATATVWPIRWWARTSARLRADGAGDLGQEEPLAELGERLLALPAQRGEGEVGHARRVTAEHLAVDDVDHGAEQVGDDLAVTHPVAVEGGGGVAGDQRAVEVEERTHLGPSGRSSMRGDLLADGRRQSAHRADSTSSARAVRSALTPLRRRAELGDDVDAAYGVGDLGAERLAARADVVSGVQELAVAGQRERGLVELERDGLRRVDPALELPLLPDGERLREQRVLVHGVVAVLGEPVGQHEVGVEERSQHQVGQVRVRLLEQVARGLGRQVGHPVAGEDQQLGAQVALEAVAPGEEELELEQVAHPLRLVPPDLQRPARRQGRVLVQLADGQQSQLADRPVDEDVDHGVAVERGHQVLVVTDAPRARCRRRTPPAPRCWRGRPARGAPWRGRAGSQHRRPATSAHRCTPPAARRSRAPRRS